MTVNSKPLWLCTLSIMALLYTGAIKANPPACSSTEFDADGDGWGWENFRSCIVTSDTTEATDPVVTPAGGNTDDDSQYIGRHPVCTLPDVDGDGWGWENNRSCIVGNNNTDNSADDTDNEDDESGGDGTQQDDDTADNDASDDPDTDTDPVTGFDAKGRPYCTSTGSDPDGDGWGWENNRTCVVVTTQTDNDPDADTDTGTDTDTDTGTDTGSDEPNDTDDTDASDDDDKSDPANGIVYQQDFENASNGLYQSDQLNDGWNRPFWHLGFDQGRVSITSDSTHGKVMRVTYPAGAYGSNGASAFLSDVQFGMELPKTYDELYLSYDIMFADDFDFVLGGKLPGLCGANSDNALTEGCNTGGGKPSGFDGWSARGMWRIDGALEHYTYHAGQQNFWADSFLWNVKAQRGAWHRVQHRVVLNTVGQANGILEAWIDGNRVLRNTGLEFRRTESVGINLFYFSTFFGGNDPSWAPKTDQHMYFDNFVISTRKTD